MRYPAILEGGDDGYGVWFPDIDGIGAMGRTIDEALVNAREVLRDYAIEAERDGRPLATPSSLEDLEVPAGSVWLCCKTPPLLQKGGGCCKSQAEPVQNALGCIGAWPPLPLISFKRLPRCALLDGTGTYVRELHTI